MPFLRDLVSKKHANTQARLKEINACNNVGSGIPDPT